MSVVIDISLKVLEAFAIPLLLFFIYRRMGKRDKISDQRYADRSKKDTLELENLNANGKLAKSTAKLLVKLVKQEKPNGEVKELEDYIQYQTDISHELDDHVRMMSQR